MQYDYFVAARYRNKAEALKLTEAIRSKGYSVYCFAESRASKERVDSLHTDSELAMRQFESLDVNDPGLRDVFETDLAAERVSKNFILLLPAGMSCHVEAGIAFGLGKHMILIGKPEKSESLYGIFADRYPDQQTFIDQLPNVSN